MERIEREAAVQGISYLLGLAEEHKQSCFMMVCKLAEIQTGYAFNKIQITNNAVF
jgi:hypothetical protein